LFTERLFKPKKGPSKNIIGIWLLSTATIYLNYSETKKNLISKWYDGEIKVKALNQNPRLKKILSIHAWGLIYIWLQTYYHILTPIQKSRWKQKNNHHYDEPTGLFPIENVNIWRKKWHLIVFTQLQEWEDSPNWEFQ